MTADLGRRGLEFDEVEHQWIPMPDGVRLAARLWLPRETGPVPAILEYIPYRKRDMVRARDERNHPHFASNGYACLRVDMRGSGDSEGHMPDMYSDDELADARHVIKWIAAQPWCNGKVGMFGTSWGGTASMQAAVKAPRALKAVIANCATTDRFEDDIHWMGGCLLTDSFEWGATLPAILAAPPDAATVGPGWKEMWRKRLDGLSFPLSEWISRQTRGAYWRHGSVKFSTDDLSCPILAIGGWADRYSNSVIGLVKARPDLCHGIVGPWGHHYPDQGEPGPAMSFQDVALTWWDHWLKEAPMPNWPRLRLWQRAFDVPADRIAMRAGRWISTDLSETHAMETALYPGKDGLSWQTGPGTRQSVPADPQHGACAGDTGYFGRAGGLPLDQSPDDARALCFDTESLETEVHLVGHAEFHCGIVRDLAQAQLACRLCEVDTNGKVKSRHAASHQPAPRRNAGRRRGISPWPNHAPVSALPVNCLSFFEGESHPSVHCHLVLAAGMACAMPSLHAGRHDRRPACPALPVRHLAGRRLAAATSLASRAFLGDTLRRAAIPRMWRDGRGRELPPLAATVVNHPVSRTGLEFFVNDGDELHRIDR